MKTLKMIAAGVAVTAMTVLGAGHAHADFADPVELSDSDENLQDEGFAEYAVNRAAPGSCLVVQNHTGKGVTMRLNYPASRGKWQFRHDQIGVLTHNGKVVTSPSGRWNVRTNPPIRFVWVYDATMNRHIGCNGAWLLTMN